MKLCHLFPASYGPHEAASATTRKVWVFPGPRLSMRFASPAVLVTFCTGLWISNHVLAQGLEPGMRPRADCEGERCVTCLHGGDTVLSPAVT